MCDKILSMIINLYPINLKINKSLFFKMNLVVTIILIIIMSIDSVSDSYKILFAYVTIIIFSPIGIYQLLNNHIYKSFGKIGSFILCVQEIILILLFLIWVKTNFL